MPDRATPVLRKVKGAYPARCLPAPEAESGGKEVAAAAVTVADDDSGPESDPTGPTVHARRYADAYRRRTSRATRPLRKRSPAGAQVPCRPTHLINSGLTVRRTPTAWPNGKAGPFG